MSARRRAKLTLAAVAVLAVPLAIASMAFACARLATLKLDRAGGTPGARVGAEGRNFSNDAASSPVALRLNSRRGPVLWEGRPNRRGRIRASFTIPSARAGHYVILATQQTAEGRPAAGTPARAPLRVRSSSRSAAAAFAGPAPDGGGGGLPGAPAALVPLLLLAVGTGGAAVPIAASRRRRAGTPAHP
jgi:hypothetical protein